MRGYCKCKHCQEQMIADLLLGHDPANDDDPYQMED